MSQSWFVLVESNSSGTGQLFPLAARRLGLRPVVFTDQPSRYPYLAIDHVEHREVQTSDPDQVLSAFHRLESEAPVAGVYSSSEYFIATAATLAAITGLPGPNPSAIAACRNKWEQRTILSCAGLAPLRFSRVTSPDEVLIALRHHTLPVVLKPVSGTGSAGVKLCRSLDEVRHHAGTLLSRPTNERGIPVPSEALIEDYIEGPEYSVESFSGQVIGITRKHVSPEPYFVETGHDFPAELAQSASATVASTVLAALKALGLTWGPSHTEFRLTPQGPVIMEVNPRLAGGFIPELIRLALGIDLIEASVALAAGLNPSLQPLRQTHASIRFLTCPGEGDIAAIEGAAQISSAPDLMDLRFYKKAGDSCRVEHDFRDRLGHVITSSPSGIAAAELANRYRSQISIELSAAVR